MFLFYGHCHKFGEVVCNSYEQSMPDTMNFFCIVFFIDIIPKNIKEMD